MLSMHEEAYVEWFCRVWCDPLALEAAWRHCVAAQGTHNAARLLLRGGRKACKLASNIVEV